MTKRKLQFIAQARTCHTVLRKGGIKINGNHYMFFKNITTVEALLCCWHTIQKCEDVCKQYVTFPSSLFNIQKRSKTFANGNFFI